VTDSILTDMCRQGIIEPGNYIVKVCW